MQFLVSGRPIECLMLYAADGLGLGVGALTFA
jgi:hypothetical protein